MRGHISRRQFVREAALGTGALLLANARAARTYAANDKLNIALIGVGGRGKWYADVMFRQANVVAFCDVNESKATAARREHPDVPMFHDFRVMLDKQKEIDGVIVATPDHTHAIAAVAAMKAGKHAFVEKPLCGCVYEARTMREVAEKHKVATQMGNQGSSGGQFRRGVELIQDGVLGDIKEVYVWNSGGGQDYKQPPQGEQPVPPYLKWDLWLGPNKERPFNAKWLAWPHWREFGTGQLGMWGSHTNYLTFLSLKILGLWHADPSTKPRIKVRAETSGINRLSFPRWEKVHFTIPARGELPPVTIHWVNGGAAQGWKEKLAELIGSPSDWPAPKEQAKGKEPKKAWSEFAGAMLLGTKGRLHSTGHNYTIDLLPAKQFEGVDISRPQRLTQSHGMPEPDWLHVARDGKWTAWSSFASAGPYMEMLLLVNVATQFDAELEYDPLEGKITNHPEADLLLRRPYREGWTL
ncbi:MAG TPA: Gfo/Idh/MocA family oxidoreductase [Planctomycetota bacterium]|nr:Gfo/Idh/MocA family oxidoreductase [Planctomycetota bacterium]